MNEHDEITVEEGRTNVYADLGYSDAAEMHRESRLAGEIARAFKARRLTQEDAAALLGNDVKIMVRPVPRRAGKIELQFA